jgi:hypothetical protein
MKNNFFKVSYVDEHFRVYIAQFLLCSFILIIIGIVTGSIIFGSLSSFLSVSGWTRIKGYFGNFTI